MSQNEIITNFRRSRFYPGPGTKVFEMHYQLPKELTCRQCVLQWRYVAGNNWGRPLLPPSNGSHETGISQWFLSLAGTCKNGTGAVGCGPQEEFRACADITITEEDGSADDTPNLLVDPDVYVPRDDDAYNEVDYEDQADYEKTLEEEVRVEGIIIVALLSLFISAAFFALLFLYYTRGKAVIERYVGDREWPEVHMPKMPSVSMPKMPSVPKVGDVHWPLSNVQIKKLPNFMKKVKGTPRAVKPVATATTISAPIQVLSNTANLKADTLPNRPHVAVATAPVGGHGPKAPPRVKKQAPSPTGPPPPSSQTRAQQAGPRLATVGTSRQQQHQHASGRPSAPPPVVPPSVPPVLEIGQPTAVTINGVSVGGGGGGARVMSNGSAAEEVTVQKTASSDVMGGMLVPARPAIADADMPDSMEQQDGRPQEGEEGEDVPPPLPTCPHPELDAMDGGGVANNVSEA